VRERKVLTKLVTFGLQMILDESSSSSESEDDDVFLFIKESSSGSETSIETIDDIVVPTIKSFAEFFHTAIVDTTIVFEGYNKTIDDFNDAQCLQYFRFRKWDLQLVSNEMLIGMQQFFIGRKFSIKCGTYVVPYETGLCIETTGHFFDIHH
jgi:hypothetical protein